MIETGPIVCSGHGKTIYNGGLEHIFGNLNNDVGLYVFDFTEVGMGYPLLMTLGEGDYIFQTSNL